MGSQRVSYTHASYTASQSHSVTHFYTLKFVTSVTHSHGGHTSCTVTHSYITQLEEVTTSISTTVTTTATHSMGSPCHTSLHDTCGVTLSQSKKITHSCITDFTHVPHHVPPVSRMHPASQTDTQYHHKVTQEQPQCLPDVVSHSLTV